MKIKIFIPIVLKLTVLISFILLSVTLYISYRNTLLFEEISIDREEETNLKMVESAANEADSVIHSYIDKLNFYGLDIYRNSMLDPESKLVASEEAIFASESEIMGLAIFTNEETSAKKQIYPNSKLSPKNLILKTYLDGLTRELESKNAQIFSGKVLVLNLSKMNGFPLIGIGLPLIKERNGAISSVIWGFIKIERFQKTFSQEGERIIFAVDSEGKSLGHPKEEYVLNSNDFFSHAVVKDALKSTIRVKQRYFEDIKNKEKILGAYAKTSLDIIVVSEIPMSFVLAPSLLVKKTSYYVLGIAFSLSLFFIFIFSMSITNPIEKLLDITKEIASGNFDVEAKKSISSHDELGLLASAFDDMTEGLKERDKVKSLFSKFHGTTVADELLQGEISLGGTRKEVIVFFSDIRGFTDFAEGHTPEEVVSMLNEYFEVMVHIINKNGGVVDKFIGDAIMAVWGVPNQTEDDPINALTACLEMRLALNELNDSRIARELSPIKIGMGLHAGEAISGQIGSNERMEYTVIGDTVNTASRIEGSTKSFGTDLLISRELAEKIPEGFIFEKAGEAKVQGKTENLVLFKVNGVESDGVLRIIQTPYSSYEAVEDKKSKVA